MKMHPTGLEKSPIHAASVPPNSYPLMRRTPMNRSEARMTSMKEGLLSNSTRAPWAEHLMLVAFK